MNLGLILENSTHDYTGDGHFRVCANFCGAYFLIVRADRAPDDFIERGCRVPDGVDIFGECPKAGRLEVETSYDAPADRTGSALLLTGLGSNLEISICRKGEARWVNYNATPETVLQIREWLAKNAPFTPFATGTAAMHDIDFGRAPAETPKVAETYCCGVPMVHHDSESREERMALHCPKCRRRIPEQPLDSGAKVGQAYPGEMKWLRGETPWALGCAAGPWPAGLSQPSGPTIHFTGSRVARDAALKSSTHDYSGEQGECRNGCGAIYGKSVPWCPMARHFVSVPVGSLSVLRAVATGPTSGADKRCAFCHSFPPEHKRYPQAGSPGDCPVIAARKILMARGEKWDLNGRI